MEAEASAVPNHCECQVSEFQSDVFALLAEDKQKDQARSPLTENDRTADGK
jgi:hypothetical protein